MPSTPSLPTYTGPFGRSQAERLLWRAGVGPRPGEADQLAAMGLTKAVEHLLRPPKAQLTGPAPHDGKGRPLAPEDAWGHDHLWWLDRMVRTNQPLVERMTLVWHDWFATSRDGAPARLMLRQNRLLRAHALGSFPKLLREVTRDPAMLLWLSGTSNNRWAPNENYARELMELFTLGVNRGYTEQDVRELARALTGWVNDWDDRGAVNFRFSRKAHDDKAKRVFGKKGTFDWRDACDLCVEHRAHPSFFVRKLWGAFIPTAPSKADSQKLQRLYVRGGHEITPVLRAILRHPALHEGPRMVTPPVVYTAGLLRARGRGIDTDAWTWIADQAGQRLFLPPNVAGWDESRWLDTGTFRGRWLTAETAAADAAVKDTAVVTLGVTADQAVDDALAFWGSPTITAETRAGLVAYATGVLGKADKSWKLEPYTRMRTNALRVLVATSPDLMTS